ncbi:MAG: DUF4832 domain-containing protein [Muricoprocola sp.]
MKSKEIRMGIFIILIIVLAVCGYIFVTWKANTWKQEFPEGEKPVTNPLKGFVAWGENYREDPWVSFAYVPVYWNLLEPEEGKYDFEELEERCHFKKWGENHVRLILRVVADSPSEERHMDIPQWLYEKMGEAGDWYDSDYGKGFSPDYRSTVFQEAHAKLIQALADRYGENPQVAFLQLGSLGHWGEWHVNTEAGIEQFPYQNVTDQYVQDYLNCFPASKLLLRRSYEIGAREGLGLYNDSFGDEKSHKLWLSWIKDGYVSDQNQEKLSGMPDFWKKAPSGGEFATSEETDWYFNPEQFDTTMQLLLQSHTTFLGPNAPKYDECSGEIKQNVEILLQNMGYCLGIRQCTLKREFFSRKLNLELVWENAGIAPLYQDWPIYLELRDEEGKMVWSNVYESNLSSWTPGTHIFSCELTGAEKLPKGEYTLYAGIMDPWVGESTVTLDMAASEMDLNYELVEFSLS